MGKKLTDDDINSLTARGEAGDFLVCVELGERYFEGKGVGVDYDKAEHFFLLAEKAGLHCENGLGCVYLSKDTPEDFVKAVDYLSARSKTATKWHGFIWAIAMKTASA